MEQEREGGGLGLRLIK